MEIVSIPLTDIDADEKFNCRGIIAPIDVVDLVKDIREKGLLQAIIVKKDVHTKEISGKLIEYKYKLIAGFRRFMAHKVMAENTIFATINEGIKTEIDAKIFNLSENLQRKNLNIVQEAKALATLKLLGLTEYETAEKLGMSRGWVQARYMILKLPQEIQLEIEAGFLGSSHVRELYSIYISSGKDATYEAAKIMKTHKSYGAALRKNRIKKRHKVTDKVKRNMGQIHDMLEYIQGTIGNGLHTRCLSWCTGAVSDKDLYESIKDYAHENDLNYRTPKEVQDALDKLED